METMNVVEQISTELDFFKKRIAELDSNGQYFIARILSDHIEVIEEAITKNDTAFLEATLKAMQAAKEDKLLPYDRM